jgi:hypothetical protein
LLSPFSFIVDNMEHCLTNSDMPISGLLKLDFFYAYMP